MHVQNTETTVGAEEGWLGGLVGVYIYMNQPEQEIYAALSRVFFIYFQWFHKKPYYYPTIMYSFFPTFIIYLFLYGFNF